MDPHPEVQVQNRVTGLLLRASRDRDAFLRKMEELERRFGDELYPSLLYTTAHLEFQKRTAKKHWREIARHWDVMNREIGREVDFRVALLDYFLDVNKRIKNPKIIEIKIFQKTQEETVIDELTRLYNYRYFTQALEREIVRADRYHAPLSVVLFDVDDFKHYNDTNGHLTGNRALKRLAQLIKGSVRDVDVVARYGGEEFALILPETNKEGALVIAERIRAKVARSTFPKGERQPLRRFTVSGGVATLHVDAAKAADLVKKADQALYRAKSRGKNQVALYEEERRDYERVSASIMGRLAIASDAGDVFSVQNISEGGLLFDFSKAIPLGAILHLSLNLPGRKTPIQCKAKVRRVEEIRRNRRYEIGVSVIQIREAERRALKRFIRAAMKQGKA